jgi:uncharacterized FlgJ-related protein
LFEFINGGLNQRKNAFFTYLLPMVKKENNKIKQVRSLIKNNQFNDMQIKKHSLATIMIFF